MRRDTIAAISSTAGEGAVALIRVSGPEAVECFSKIWQGVDADRMPPRTMQLGRIAGTDGTTLDQVLAVRFPAPHSYTGEEMVEISCHGGTLVARSILERLFDAGCQSAEPGEFTQRAFLNGKIDLTQAEAVMDLIQAKTRLALRAANDQLSGGLRQAIETLRSDLVDLLAQIEAWIDFPEEDIEPESLDQLATRAESLSQAVDALLASAGQGRVLREGARAVICGAPNAGKSSLLNLLTGFDRAIVSESAGTTRDTIEEVINLGGIPLRLIDTAGLRHAEEPVEKEGVRRTAAEIERADVVIEVIDASAPLAGPGTLLPPGFHGLHLRLLNKSDLGTHADWAADTGGIRFSCRTSEGLDLLQEALQERLVSGDIAGTGLLIAVNARHQQCLEAARTGLRRVLQGLRENVALEFVALECRDALDALGEIVGKTDVEGILGAIFSRFCIGK